MLDSALRNGLVCLGLLALLPGGVSCYSCNDIACRDQLKITLPAPIDANAEYKLSLETPRGTLECEVIPVFPDSGLCGSLLFVIQDGELIALDVSGSPSSFRLVVQREGAVLIDRTVTGVRYSDIPQPRDACGQDPCRGANVQL